MSNKSAAASRVAVMIGVVKWIVVAVQVVTGVIFLFVFNAQEDWPTWTAAAGPVTLIWFLLSALLSWVVFGWFQHVLGMLAAIAGAVTPAEKGAQETLVDTGSFFARVPKHS